MGLVSRDSAVSGNGQLISIGAPFSPATEAYRTLRTQVRSSSVDGTLRTLVVSSPNQLEGKSTTVANLGVVIAQTGKTVVLVDCDLRRPALHTLFGLPNEVGLTTALLGDGATLADCLQESGVDNLRILTSGPLPPHPSELLASEKMRQAIEQLEREADLVLFDTPPALPFTDATVLAVRAKNVLLVVEVGRTRRGALRRVAEMMRQGGAWVLGVALNRAPREQMAGYGYYYSQRSERGRRWPKG
ncbi:MAG: CpsD/CapB family tyrosine-protein kinase [Chloroflexi bacterium]|nr:CpsD/CapB family tyrosine-protein kinase [Chloroflexota bacterium]